jgi:hypothetical protein
MPKQIDKDIIFKIVKDFYGSLSLPDKYVLKLLFYHDELIENFKRWINAKG